METLLLVAERDGPEMMARIGMMRAMHQRTNSQIAAPHNVQSKSR
jgi:hypothetical protein